MQDRLRCDGPPTTKDRTLPRGPAQTAGQLLDSTSAARITNTKGG